MVEDSQLRFFSHVSVSSEGPLFRGQTCLVSSPSEVKTGAGSDVHVRTCFLSSLLTI